MSKPKSTSREGLANYLVSHEHQGGIIVCEERKFIYMKPSRTGGTSILRKVLEPEITSIFHSRNNRPKFNTWIQNISDKELETYFIFSFARNPWDRMVSVSSYFKIQFDGFIQNFDKHLESTELKLHSLPIYLYTYCNGNKFVDFIGRFETLQKDFEKICDKIEIKRTILPHTRKSIHNHYSEYYNDETRRLVADLYSEDIKNFGYEFEEK